MSDPGKRRPPKKPPFSVFLAESALNSAIIQDRPAEEIEALRQKLEATIKNPWPKIPIP